jgi:hypothetical protein
MIRQVLVRYCEICPGSSIAGASMRSPQISTPAQATTASRIPQTSTMSTGLPMRACLAFSSGMILLIKENSCSTEATAAIHGINAPWNGSFHLPVGTGARRAQGQRRGSVS